MQDLKICLIQSDLHWQQPQANMAMFEEKIWSINEQIDLIILPEMFTTGFTMNAEPVAEPPDFTTIRWMRQIAMQKNCVVTGSYIAKDTNRFYNRLIWMQPDGAYEKYDKRHLFRMAGEHEVFAFGDKKIIKEIKGWKICPLICYDLRFPVWSRNTKDNMYDLLVYVANWPEVRRYAWQTLLKARSIENICYTAGVNRVGTDGNQHPYAGDSVVLNFKGEILKEISYKEDIIIQTLSWQPLKDFRDKFPAFLDGDQFDIL